MERFRRAFEAGALGREYGRFSDRMEDEMNTQVLVTYATKYSATAEIAEKIGQVLRQGGLHTDVLPTDRVSDLSPYKAVVLDSALHIGKIQLLRNMLEGKRDNPC